MIITAGVYKGRKLLVPDENITRPTLSKVRMGVFNTLYSLLGSFEGMSFLDVFAGSGVMSLEALSRGFEQVKLFEKNLKSAEIIKRNFKSLGIKPDLCIGDSLNLIKKVEGSYNVAYIDPPYQSDLYKDILSLVKAEIFVVEGLKDYCPDNFSLIKVKNYGGTFVTYLTKDYE